MQNIRLLRLNMKIIRKAVSEWEKLTGEKVDDILRGKLQRIQQQGKKRKEDRNVLRQKKSRER